MWWTEPNIRPNDDPSEGCDWLSRRFVRRMIRPMDVIGWAEASVLWFFRRMLRSLLIGWAEATCPYDEASALSSCQMNLIGREGNLIFSSWTRLIGLSDGLVLLRTLLIGQSADQRLASSLGFLTTQYQTCKRADEKTITRKRFLWATNTPFWPVLDAKTDKTNVTLCYLLYPWWSIYTVHYAHWWSSVSVFAVVE